MWPAWIPVSAVSQRRGATNGFSSYAYARASNLMDNDGGGEADRGLGAKDDVYLKHGLGVPLPPFSG